MKDMINEIENMIALDREQTLKSNDLIVRVLANSEEIMKTMKKPSIIAEKQKTPVINKKQEPVAIAEKEKSVTINKKQNPEAVYIPLTCVCGKPWSEKAKFCKYCGSPKPVVEAMVLKCPNGHDINPDAKFCRICGVKIKS